MKGQRVSLLAGAALAAVPVGAASVFTLDIEHRAGRYELVSDAYLEASPEAIFEVLTDYDRFDRISSVYKETGFMEPAPDGTPLIYTRMEGCVLFFCKSMRRVERLETDAPRFIRTVTLPGQSDFTYSSSEWVLEPDANGTKMTYRLVMEPNFWVPPLVGPWLLKRSLWHGGIRAVNRIERLARELMTDSGHPF